MDPQMALAKRGKPVPPSEPPTRLTEKEARDQIDRGIKSLGLKPGQYYVLRRGPHHSDTYRISTFALILGEDLKSKPLAEASFIPA